MVHAYRRHMHSESLTQQFVAVVHGVHFRQALGAGVFQDLLDNISMVPVLRTRHCNKQVGLLRLLIPENDVRLLGPVHHAQLTEGRVHGRARPILRHPLEFGVSGNLLRGGAKDKNKSRASY